MRNDTVEYLASAYKAPEVHKVQDLLARLEGFSISPDGRVHFNGQEIETILLNGEDMTGSNYRLLSQYLRAGLVKKVQVIRDYDPDPLMRELKRSGKIGLSLVLYDSLVRSVSGGVDIGASVSGRKDMDLHLISLHGPRKAIALAKWNSMGETVTGNRDYYAGDGVQDGPFTRPPERSTPAQTGMIHPPSLPEPYVRDNDDASGSMIWKQNTGVGQQLGVVLGLDHSFLVREQSRIARYALPDGAEWTMGESERTRAQALHGFLRLEHTEDRGRKGRGRIMMDVHGMTGVDTHTDELSGALSDRLRERDLLKTISVTGNIRESWRVRRGAVLMDGSLSLQHEDQVFTIMGEGVAGIVMDSGAHWLQQSWQGRGARQELSLKFISARRRHSNGWGLRYRGLTGHRLSAWDISHPDPGGLAFALHSLLLEGDWERRLGRNGRLQSSISVGLGSWRIGQDTRVRITELHDVVVGYQCLVSPFRGWGLSYRDARVSPEDKYALPREMASGRYTVISPMQVWMPSSLHQLSFDAHVRNLAVGAGMMFLIRYTRHEHDILSAMEMAPGLTRITPMPVGRSDDLHANLGGDAYISPVRMKLSGSLHLTAQWGKALVNRIGSDREMLNAGLGLRLVSGWKGPLNLDAAWNLDNNRYQDKTASGVQSNSTWSRSVRLKVRWRWHERWYGALSVERVSTPGLPSFVTMDLFLSWQCHERLSFSVTGHNLLDHRHAISRWVGPGSEGEAVYRVVPAYVVWKLSWGLG